MDWLRYAVCLAHAVSPMSLQGRKLSAWRSISFFLIFKLLRALSARGVILSKQDPQHLHKTNLMVRQQQSEAEATLPTALVATRWLLRAALQELTKAQLGLATHQTETAPCYVCSFLSFQAVMIFSTLPFAWLMLLESPLVAVFGLIALPDTLCCVPSGSSLLEQGVSCGRFMFCSQPHCVCLPGFSACSQDVVPAVQTVQPLKLFYSCL